MKAGDNKRQMTYEISPAYSSKAPPSVQAGHFTVNVIISSDRSIICFAKARFYGSMKIAEYLVQASFTEIVQKLGALQFIPYAGG